MPIIASTPGQPPALLRRPRPRVVLFDARPAHVSSASMLASAVHSYAARVPHCRATPSRHRQDCLCPALTLRPFRPSTLGTRADAPYAVEAYRSSEAQSDTDPMPSLTRHASALSVIETGVASRLGFRASWDHPRRECPEEEVDRSLVGHGARRAACCHQTAQRGVAEGASGTEAAEGGCGGSGVDRRQERRGLRLSGSNSGA